MKRLTDHNKILPILEIYSAVQAEGSRMGKPTIVIRTTGCTHRCYFGEGGWCDSWYTSIHPEKGKYTFNDIIKMYDENPHIKEMMLTGGSPSMHPVLVNELTHFAKERGIFITMETEGSHFLETDNPIGLLSISPKFSNSIPQLGVKTPQGVEVTQKMIDLHNRFRLNTENIAKSIIYHNDFHIKPVIAKDLSNLEEVEVWLDQLKKELDNQSKHNYNLKEKVWMMPAGDTREALIESYGPVINMCRDKGYNFTGRAHIIAFGTERCV